MNTFTEEFTDRLRTPRLIPATAILLCLAWPARAGEVEVNTQESAGVATSKLVAAELLKGQGYQLAPTTIVYQGVALFDMETEFGDATVVGGTGLQERIAELNAIEQLREMQGTSVYAEAAKGTATAPLDTIKNLATSPIDTMADIGRGLGGFMADVGYSVISDNPNQDNVAKTAVGFATAKRQFAHDLGVNPYSSFQPLQDELNAISWTSVGGGLTVQVAFMAIGGTAGSVVSTSGTAESMRALVRDNSPRKLANINEEKLLKMGVKEALAEVMIDNHNYDPENQTRLIGALAGMEGVPGREEFIARAALQDQPYNARLMREWAELFALYHANVQKVKSIVVVQTAPFLVLEDGASFGLFPADYIAMDPTFEARNRALVTAMRAQGLEPGEAWLTGVVNPAMEPLMKNIGWKRVVGDASALLQKESEG